MQTEQPMQQQNEETDEKQNRAPPDPELTAIRRIRGVLADLSPTARERVLSYVADRSKEERWNLPMGQQVPSGFLGEQVALRGRGE